MLLFALFCVASLPTVPLQSPSASPSSVPALQAAPRAVVVHPAPPQERVEVRSMPRSPQGDGNGGAQNGASRPGRLGVALQEAPHGVGIGTVEPGSPAERAGLRAGDRIVVVEGRQTLDFDAVVGAVRAKGAGEELALIVERDLAVEVQNLPSQGGSPRPRLGILLSAESRELRAAEVESDGPAEHAGVLAGDRLLSVDGTPTPDAAALRDKVGSLEPGTRVTLTVARDFRVRLAEARDAAGSAQTMPTPFAAPGAGGRPSDDEFFRTAPVQITPVPPLPPAAPDEFAGARKRDRAAAREAARAQERYGRQQAPLARGQGRAGAQGQPGQAAPHGNAEVDTRELTEALRGLRSELAELRRELGELRRELGDRRGR